MKMILIKFIMTIYMIIPFLKTPMSMGILLLLQAMMMTLLISMIMTSSWMAMIVFLIMVGGLLILFMYMSSIASNEKFSMNIFMMIFIITMIMPMEELLSEAQTDDPQKMISQNEIYTLTKIYNKKTLMITIFLFIYMFLSMVVVTKIIKIYSGPLRSSK